MVRRRIRVKRNRKASSSKASSRKASNRQSGGKRSGTSKHSQKQNGGVWPYNELPYTGYPEIDYAILPSYAYINGIAFASTIDNFLLNDYYYSLYLDEAIVTMDYQLALWELGYPTTVTYYNLYDPYIYWLNGYTDYLVKIDEKNNNSGKPNPSVNKTVEVVNGLINHIKAQDSYMRTKVIPTSEMRKLVVNYLNEHVKVNHFDTLQSIIDEMTDRVKRACSTANNTANKCVLYKDGMLEVSKLIENIMEHNDRHTEYVKDTIAKFRKTLSEINIKRPVPANTLNNTLPPYNNSPPQYNGPPKYDW
jgi:hypothetical protein